MQFSTALGRYRRPRSVIGVTPTPTPGTNIPDVGAPASSPTTTATTFGPFNTTSIVHSIFWKWTGVDTSFYLCREADAGSASLPTKALQLRTFNGTSFQINKIVGGVVENTNMANNPLVTAPIPVGTEMSLTRNVDGTVTMVRLDTNAAVATAGAVFINAYFPLATWQGTYTSAHSNTAITNIRSQGNATPLTVNSLAVSNDFQPTIDINYTGGGHTGYNLERRYAGSGPIGAKVAALIEVLSPGHLKLTAPPSFAFGADQYGSQVAVRIYELINGVETGVFRDTLPYTMPAAAVTPLHLGYNFGTGNYYVPFPMSADIGASTENRTDLNVLLMPYSGINGTYTATVTPPNIVLAPYNGSVSTGITVSNSNFTTGTHRIVINKDNQPDIGDGNARGLGYSGGTVTSFTMVPEGSGLTAIDPNPRYVSESLRGAGMRDLDICSANYTPGDGSYITLAQWPDRISLPLRAFAAKHAIDPNFNVYHHVQALVITDEVVQRDAERVRDLLPDNATVKIIHELSNEVWSDGFLARGRTQVEAAREGFLNGGTPENPGLKLVVKISTAYNSSPAMATGECLWGGSMSPELGSYNLVRALRPVAAGTPIVIGPDFELYAGLQALLEGGLLWEGYRHNQCLAIWESVLGTARYQRQVLPGIYCQVGSSPKQRNPQLDAVPGYRQKVKIIGTSFYMHHEPALYQANSGLTPQILADAFLATLPANKAKILAHISDMREMGPFQFGMYEGGQHPMNYAGATQHYIDVMAQLERSTLCRAIEYDWTKAVQETCSGYCFYYTGQGPVWGLIRDWNPAVTRYRLEGHLAAMNGEPRPAYA